MSALKINRIRLENVLTWKSLRLNFESGLFSLIGPNDSGKSNVFRALELLGRLSHLDVKQALQPYGGLEAVVTGCDADLQPLFVLSGHLGQSEFEWTLRLGSTFPGAPEIEAEMLRLGDVEYIRRDGALRYPSQDLPIPVTQGAWSRLSLPAMVVQQPAPESAIRRLWTGGLRKIAAGLSATTSYRLRPDSIARPCAPTSTLTLSPSGEGLAGIIERLASDPDHQEQFQNVKQSLGKLIPHVESVGAISDGSDPPQRLLRFRNRFQNGATLSYNAPQASEGTLLALAYLTLAEGPNPSPFLMIEEPENGLHPGRLKEIVNILRHIGNKQVIITTHSPYLLDALKPEEVAVVTRNPRNGTSELKLMSDIQDLDSWRKSFSTGEIWTNALMSDGA